MKVAPPTNDEQKRLQALYDYDVLDTDAEKVFDDLTLLASQICGTSISLISLVDTNRQWFKSKVGIGAAETSRDIAFCAHAIHQRSVFEVQDTLLDERFADNPLVTSAPNIRFYAGTPLVTPQGHAIGTLCAIDDKPNRLSEEQRNSLEILGRSVISQFELRKTIKKLKIASQHKTEFLSNMSHELRTPLNAIIGFSSLMLNEIESQVVSSKFHKYLVHLDYSGKRLLSVINSVLDLNKIEEGKMHLDISSIHFPTFFKSINDMFSISSEEQGVSLSISLNDSVSEFLYFDEAKLAQILLNLISNALKYSPRGARVEVNIDATDTNLIIAVKDYGVGISKTDQLKLFNKFQQVGNAKYSQGSGLGLSITKSLVELMKGKIKLNSAIGKGSLFKVVLPLNLNITHAAVQHVKSQNQDFRQDSQILVVEDNFINQEVVKAIFDSLGLSIKLASSGEEAIKMVQKHKFELVFMDIHLPGINGLEATRLIKQNHPDLIIVGLSADAFEQQNLTKKNNVKGTADISDFLLKPLDKEKLIQVLNHFLPATNDTNESL